jgi:uncharacterized protein with PIN domain
MNVVDSSGRLEYFGDGRNAAHFAVPLAEPDSLIVPATSVFEVFRRVSQQRDDATALQAAALMQQGRVVALDAALAMTAAKLAFELKLPMGDGIILAKARQFNAVLWRQAADFENLPGARYVAAARA